MRRHRAAYRCQLHSVGFFSDVKIANAEQWRHKDQSTTGTQILHRLVALPRPASSLPTLQSRARKSISLLGSSPPSPLRRNSSHVNKQTNKLRQLPSSLFSIHRTVLASVLSHLPFETNANLMNKSNDPETPQKVSNIL